MKETKYKARPVTIDGYRFASQAEGNRYRTLRLMLLSGAITDFELQPVFQLAPGVLVPGESKRRPPLRYVADFRYRDSCGREIVEDCKGVETPVFRMKMHLLALQGIKVEIVK